MQYFLLNMKRLMHHPEKGTTHVLLQINTVKSISIFINQAGFAPVSSTEFLGNILKYNIITEFVETFKGILPKDGHSNAPNSLHRACVHALAVAVHITQGDF